MAIDIVISNQEYGPRGAGIALGEPTVRFDDDAYYWFMWPLFETLAKRTSQLIDLYGDATFRGDSLAALRDVVLEARRLVLTKPDSWDVVVGWTDTSRKQERYATATRTDFLRLLDDFDRVIARADDLGKSVVCLGD